MEFLQYKSATQEKLHSSTVAGNIIIQRCTKELFGISKVTSTQVLRQPTEDRGFTPKYFR